MSEFAENSKGALALYDENGSTAEEIAAPVIETTEAVLATIEEFNATRGLPNEDAWYVIYSYGVPGGDYNANNRWFMSMGKTVSEAVSSVGDTTSYSMYSPTSSDTSPF